MEIPTKIRIAAERLKAGHRVNRITVRDFLRHFEAERRGAIKVEAIRRILDRLEIQTDPDFTTAWIDAPIWLRLKDGVRVTEPLFSEEAEVGDPSVPHLDAEEIILDSTPSSVKQAELQAESAPLSTDAEIAEAPDMKRRAPMDDPTFRIGSLPAANKKLIVVSQDDQLTKAITLMLQHDFAQLPVMQGEREVKGVVTWKSIASKKAFESQCETVGDCREDPRIVDSNRTLFEAIPAIVEHGYVLVRNQRDRRITGIVTASDLSLQFQALAEPFLLLREVELHLRQLLGDKISQEDLDRLNIPAPGSQKIENVADLSFGQYVRLFQRPDIWAKLELKVDSGVLTALIEEVRLIRNDVMHFDPDPMTPEDLATLKQASRFMQSLYELLP